jgi:uncharacterized membrane protein YfcA
LGYDVAYAIIAAAAFLVAVLTLLSGFGLGTLLMPVFALFYPVAVAVAATAVVHLANNLVKLAALARRADRYAVLAFGIPSAIFAVIGAWLLTRLARLPVVYSYVLAGARREVTVVALVVGLLIIVFALLELVPARREVKLSRRWLPAGGVLSGFFGGLSGHQGAPRAAFLARAGLSPPAFIATNAVCAVMVDVARLVVYGISAYEGAFGRIHEAGLAGLVAAGVIAAIAGSLVGLRYVPKITVRALHIIVGGLLIVIGLALVTGLV